MLFSLVSAPLTWTGIKNRFKCLDVSFSFDPILKLKDKTEVSRNIFYKYVIPTSDIIEHASIFNVKDFNYITLFFARLQTAYVTEAKELSVIAVPVRFSNNYWTVVLFSNQSTKYAIP